MTTAISAQSIEKLVSFHTKTNTYLYPLNVKKLNNSVYSIYNLTNRDTLFFQNQKVETNLDKSNRNILLISKFDDAHNLQKTGIISSNYDEQCAYVSSYFYNDKIYIFSTIQGTELRYNGNVVWEGKDDFRLYYYTMTVLDLDLNFVEAKSLNHWNSGFDAIAFGDNRMYLFGFLTNGPLSNGADTVYVDGHQLINADTSSLITTMFMLTYDLTTDSIINEFKVSSNSYLAIQNVDIKVAPDGSVYQLFKSISDGIFLENDWIYLNNLSNNSLLFKYNKDGDLVDYISFRLPENEVDLSQMELTSDGDVMLYGLARYGLGFNDNLLFKFHLPYAAVILQLDGNDLGVNWYDYFAVMPGSNISVRAGGMSIDDQDNIYFLNSHSIYIPRAEDRSGNSLEAGNHIYKYAKNGLRIGDHYTYSEYGHSFDINSIGNDSLLIFTGIGGIVGTKDTITGLTKRYINELLLYEYILNKNTSSLTDNGVSPTLQVFPNPVSSSGVITITGNYMSSATSPYEIYNMMGVKCGEGRMDDEGRIDLADHRLSHGLFLIQLGDKGTRKQIKVLVE
jgi:hypothetical protein